jgi:hypothetical protein
LIWFKARHPEQYAQLLRDHPDTPPHQLSMLMYKFVQGRVDASRQWKILIEGVLLGELKLVPNRADACMYSGRIGNAIIFIGRAIDDFLIVTTPAGYEVILQTLRLTPTGEPC